MSEIVIFYFLFWWLIQIFYKITALDQEDCKIKTFVAKFDSSIVKPGVVQYFGTGALIGATICYYVSNTITDGVLFGIDAFCISWIWYAIKRSKRAIDFIYKLLECQLCMESHIGFLISIPIAYCYQDLIFMLLGYSAAGFNNIIKRLIHEGR